MAWTFSDEIHSLTNFDADDTSTTATSGETLSTHATQWLTDGARDVINALSKNPKYVILMSSLSRLNTSSPTLALTNAMVGDVSLYDGTRLQGCRAIAPNMRGRASDVNDLMNYATTSDPVYWINAKTLETYPTPTNSNYVDATIVSYPSVDYNDSSISSFPDEAEHLVVLYACQKVLQYQLNAMHTNTDITTALTAINTELDETQTICDLINTQVDAAVVELAETVTNVDSGVDTAVTAITTALGRVNTAVILANTEFDLVSPEVVLAKAQVVDEDTEIAQGYIATAQGYSKAGSNYIQEAQTSLSEAQGYANEVSARGSHVQAQLAVVSGYINAAQGYASEIQTKTGIVNGYLAEAKTRMERDNQTYQWYQSQLQNLKQDYQQGISLLVGGGEPKSQPQKGR